MTQWYNMSASPPCATPPSHVSSPSAPPIAPDTLLAAANMRRLLEVYRSLAPLTIGGPSSTSLETPGTQLPGRPPTDPRMLRKFAPYPWLMGPVFPPPPFLNNKTDPEPGPSPRKRHCSSDSGGPGGLRRPPHTASPAPPIFSPRDKESSRLDHCVTVLWLYCIPSGWLMHSWPITNCCISRN